VLFRQASPAESVHQKMDLIFLYINEAVEFMIFADILRGVSRSGHLFVI
jgi:hypothetical protein